MAMRHLNGMTPEQWDALPWDRQRMYFEGMVTEGLITRSEPAQQDGAPQLPVREAQGADVIDISAMIRDSQAAMAAKVAQG